jgi:predicted O-methyltransferase YrrM
MPLEHLPPTRVLVLHAQRVAARGGSNRRQCRAMSRAPHREIRSIANTLVARRPPAIVDRIGEIERYREHLCSAEAAAGHGLPVDQMTALARVASKSPRWAALILDLVLALKPARVLETGTAVGVSGAYIAAGLEANGSGELVTVDSNKRSHEIACGTFADLRLARHVTALHGTFADTIDALVDDGPPIDLVFKDGGHSESATTSWFDTLAPRLADRSSFLLDDIRRDRGMKAAWDRSSDVHPSSRRSTSSAWASCC